MNNHDKPLAILRIVTTIAETSEPYNQYSLPLAGKQDITLCSYFKATVPPPPATITFIEGDGTLPGFYRALKTAFDARQYDIIHIHMVIAGFLFLLANLAFGKPMRCTVFTVSNSYQSYKLRNKLMLLPVFAFFQRVVCNSHAVFDSFPVIYKWLGGKRLCTIQNGVDIDRVDGFLRDNRPAPRTGGFTVISVGRIIKIKNPLTVVNAYRKSAAPGDRLIFVGEGDMRAPVLAKARELGLEHDVRLTGLVPRNRVYETLSEADVFISCSYGEGLPVAALEAMACRCPVILSDIQPHREIANGTDFIPLVPADDSDGFAREISRFRSLPAAERQAVGERCRAWAEKHFSLASMNRQYAELFERMRSGGGPSQKTAVDRLATSNRERV